MSDTPISDPTERLQRHAPFVVVGVLLVLLWTLVIFFSASQQTRLVRQSE